MTKVFIGGSRRMGRLNRLIRARAQSIADEGLLVLIGDANGADRAMQQCFAELEYRNVVVFHAGPDCRNNVGGWETRSIASNGVKSGREFYTIKDVAMADEADYGFMLWEGKSIGTLNNILNLIQGEKKVVVYFAPDKAFVTLRSLDDLKLLIDKCAPNDLRQFENRLRLSHRLEQAQFELNMTD